MTPTSGNEACLETFEIVDHLLDDGRTDVFLLYVETIRDPPRFERVAARALAAGKPIIAVKIGKTAAGVRAARAHTGAIAGDPAECQALFRRHGIVEVDDLDWPRRRSLGITAPRRRCWIGSPRSVRLR